MTPLPRKIKLQIRPAPNAGEGLNHWLFATAVYLKSRGVAMESARRYLEEQAAKAGRLDPAEIERQLSCGYNAKPEHKPAHAQAKRPARNDDAIVELVDKYRATPDTIRDLGGRAVSDQVDPLDIIQEIHAASSEALFYIGTGPMETGQTCSLEEWRVSGFNLFGFEMVVPNPMRARTGLTKAVPPKVSCRCNDNAGPMLLAVAEADITHEDPLLAKLGITPLDFCASLILSLPRERLRMVVHSGNKSLQAWLDVRDMTPAFREALFRPLARYAVDQAGLIPCQQFRLPNGWRADKEQLQEVLYFAPNTDRRLQ